MCDRPPFAEIEFDDSADALAARAARRRWAVDEMIQMGVMLTQRLCAEVEAAAEAGAEAGVATRLGGRDPALAYSRLFRAVRLGVALGERLDQPPAEDEDESVETADELARRRLGMRGVILSATVLNVVESLIETEVEGDLGGERALRLLESLTERVENDEALEAIGERSVGESIALICKDLGLTPDWNLWRYEHWAEMEAREQTLGSPFGRPRRVAREEAPAERGWDGAVESGDRRVAPPDP